VYWVFWGRSSRSERERSELEPVVASTWASILRKTRPEESPVFQALAVGLAALFPWYLSLYNISFRSWYIKRERVLRLIPLSLRTDFLSLRRRSSDESVLSIKQTAGPMDFDAGRWTHARAPFGVVVSVTLEWLCCRSDIAVFKRGRRRRCRSGRHIQSGWLLRSLLCWFNGTRVWLL
jgi:hypothetical protein